MNLGLYLYGILPNQLPENINLIGMDNQPVYSNNLQGLTFLYSTAKHKKYLSSRRNLLTHEKVLEDVMNAGYRTLLPLRFGLVINDWETVTTELIEPYEEQLQKLLTHLGGKREVSIKIFWDKQLELQGLLEENSNLKAKRDSLQGKALRMEEVIDIGQMIEMALEQKKEQIINSFRAALNPLAKDILEGETMTADMIYNCAYLIDWEQEESFSYKVEEVDQKFGDRLRIRYNNFTAPYSFAQIN
jgi:Gas vesicle synthesis protein GvpL/GvpF